MKNLTFQWRIWSKFGKWKAWRSRIKWLVIFAGIIAAIVYLSIFAPSGILPAWTGLGPSTERTVTIQGPNGTTALKEQDGKTLWDWMGLLLIPVVLAGGAIWFNRREKENELIIENERSQDATLQAYLDQMTQLLLEKSLRNSKPEDEVRTVARARTLTTLKVLQGARKATVLQFLHEADLINEKMIINLDSADLSDLIMMNMVLRSVNLHHTNLQGAIIINSHLTNASFRGADMQDTMIIHTFLTDSDFLGTDLSGSYLDTVYVDSEFHSAKCEGCTIINLNGKDTDRKVFYDMARQERNRR